MTVLSKTMETAMTTLEEEAMPWLRMNWRMALASTLVGYAVFSYAKSTIKVSMLH